MSYMSIHRQNQPHTEVEMARISQAAGLQNPLQNVFPQPVVAQRAPTSNDKNYPVGQQWIDQSSDQSYSLSRVTSGSAVWILEGPGSSDVDTLTGDSGGAISPTAGNINILGGDGITVAGSGSTLTINRDAEGGYPITPYVVGPSGQAGYTTIQGGIDAANSAGGGLVFIQQGTYTEDLTLYDNVALFGSSESETIIVGTHTPPTSGTVNIFRLTFQDATAIFSSAAAGTTTLLIEDCTFTVTNGFTFDLANWTGAISVFDIGSGGTNDGFINNTGGATLFLIGATLGVGTGQTMISSGSVTLEEVVLNCPWDAQTGSSITSLYTQFNGSTTLSNNSTGTFKNCIWNTGAAAAITMSSSGSVLISQSTITSSNNPAIAGSGAGTLTLTDISYTSNTAKASTLTLGTADVVEATAYRTNALATGVTYSANNIDATGSDANISITVSPKGTGDFIVDVGDIQDTAGDIIATRSSAGADVTVEATNSDNTDPASRGGFEAAVGGTSAGDPYVNFLISGGQTFTIGIDNSTANDDFVISDNATLGTNNRISIDGSTGDTSILGNLALPTAATQIQVEGGAATDFIGQATLASGTATIANTNIAATDRILLTRAALNSSSALGELTITAQTASTSFVITAIDPADGSSTVTGDTSVVNYFIVRQL